MVRQARRASDVIYASCHRQPLDILEQRDLREVSDVVKCKTVSTFLVIKVVKFGTCKISKVFGLRKKNVIVQGLRIITLKVERRGIHARFHSDVK